MSADNVLGWEIVLRISHLPSKLRFSAKCSFFGQSLSRGHYQPTYQPPEGVYLLNSNYSLIRVKRRTSHEPNRMQMRKTLCSPSLTFDSAHVKCGVWPRPKVVVKPIDNRSCKQGRWRIEILARRERKREKLWHTSVITLQDLWRVLECFNCSQINNEVYLLWS